MSSPLPCQPYAFNVAILLALLACAMDSSVGSLHPSDTTQSQKQNRRMPTSNAQPRASLDTPRRESGVAPSNNGFQQSENLPADGRTDTDDAPSMAARDDPSQLAQDYFRRGSGDPALQRAKNIVNINGDSGHGQKQSSKCPTCERLQRDKLHRIESLKRQILKSIGMTRPPNVTGMPRPKIPSIARLMEQGENMMNDQPKHKRGSRGRYADDYDDDFVVKTKRVFMYAKSSPVADRFNLTDTLYFSPHIQLYTSKIKTAYLWFYIRKGTTSSNRITLTAERILPESRSDNRPILKTIFTQKLLRDKASGWKRIDMRDSLRRWLRHPMGNYGLTMRALDERGNNLIVLPPYEDTFKGYEPWLETRISEGKANSRHKRSESLRCNANTTETRCCRYPLTLRFRDFGWDWIIAPAYVQADQCSGDCRMSIHSSPHAWMTQQAVDGHESCCAPTQQSPLSLLYFGEAPNRDTAPIMFQTLQNIKVTECGCL